MLATIALLFVPYWAGSQSNTVPADFAIHFEFGCGSRGSRDIVDTSDDSYFRTLDPRAGATRTVNLQLSDAERHQLVEWVAESRFFELPAKVDSSNNKENGIFLRMPHMSYVLTVQRSGVRHRVQFDDKGDATSDVVVRIRTLVQRLSQLFTQLPQVKRLPMPAIGCL